MLSLEKPFAKYSQQDQILFLKHLISDLENRVSGLESKGGSAGPTGPAGSQGSQGSQGPKGERGQAGQAGPRGPAGESA